jgi:hypothetical protein
MGRVMQTTRRSTSVSLAHQAAITQAQMRARASNMTQATAKAAVSSSDTEQELELETQPAESSSATVTTGTNNAKLTPAPLTRPVARSTSSPKRPATRQGRSAVGKSTISNTTPVGLPPSDVGALNWDDDTVPEGYKILKRGEKKGAMVKDMKSPVWKRGGVRSKGKQGGKGKVMTDEGREMEDVSGRWSKELKGLGVAENYDESEIPEYQDAAFSGPVGRVTRRRTKAIMEAADGKVGEKDEPDQLEGVVAGPSTSNKYLSPTTRLKTCSLLNNGLPTPSNSTATSIIGSTTDCRSRTRLHRVSFATPLETPTPAPRVDAYTGPSTRQKRKLSFFDLPSLPEPKRRSPVRKEAPTQECIICAETKPIPRNFPSSSHHFPQCDHEHLACITCYTTHARNIVTARGNWDHLTCPQCNTGISGRELRALLPSSSVLSLNRIVRQKKFETDPNYHWCPQPNCGSGQLYHPKKNQNLQNLYYDPLWYNEQNMVTCKKCKRKTCFKHKIPWHEGYSCARFEDSHPEADVLRTNGERLKKTGKKCPGCDWYVEKDGGCGHMYCECHIALAVVCTALFVEDLEGPLLIPVILLHEVDGDLKAEAFD